MNSFQLRSSVLGLALLTSATLLGQQKAAPSGQHTQPTPIQQGSSKPNSQTTAKKPDRAAAYYHFGLGHMYEEMMAMYGRSDYANKAIEEYRAAIDNDPSSEFLNATLAELYAKTGRIRDAVLEAQDILKRDPNNVEAHRLLGRIYLRSLGDTQSGPTSREVLRLGMEQYEALARLEPKNADNHLLLGRLYVLNKDYGKAEGQFKAAMQTDPSSDEAVVNLALLYNEEGDTKKAAETLTSVPDPQRTSKINSTLGFTYEQQKEYKKAIAAYQKALEQDKENLDAMRGLAQNLYNDNQMDAALQQWRMVQEADPQDAQAPLRMSEIYRREGKFDQAMSSLKRAESLQQDLLEAPYDEAIILEAQGKYDEAAAVLQRLVSRSESPDGNYTSGERNNRSLFLERLGNVYREAGKTQLALDTFNKMVDLGGAEASRGYQEIIDTYREQKQWTDATRTAQEAVHKLPEDRDLKLTLAQELADDGKPEQGIQIAKSQLSGKPEDRTVYFALSQIYSRQKHWKEAEEALLDAQKLASKPEDQEYVSFLLGALYDRQKKYDQAERSFRQVLQMDSNNSMTLNYLGYMLADRNTHLEEALNLIKRAVELDPQNGAYLDSLGWVYFRLGNYDQAEENLRRAADKTPNDATVQDHLGELYAKTGKLKMAAVHWERALMEWNRSVPADVDQQDVARVQKKLESTKVKLAQQQTK
jgi:tetratricopeptide (TPR) repeat protein